MLKLEQQHIDQIRHYFIADSHEEKRTIQNTISPPFLKGFLDDLKNLFLQKPEDADALKSIAQSMGAADSLASLQDIQQEFYEHKADLYIEGVQDEDIAALIQYDNQSFFRSVAFQNELSQAFVLSERAKLKKQFQQEELANDISDTEIQDAFTLLERNKLKEQFQEIEARKKGPIPIPGQLTGVSVAASRRIEPQQPVNPFNWKRFAIAASVVGVIISTVFITINKKNTTTPIAKNYDQKIILYNKKKVKNLNTLIEEQLANNSFNSKQTAQPVYKESSFGFSQKEEIVTVKIIDVEEKIVLLQKLLDETTQGTAGNSNRSKAITNKIDSLKRLNNYYTFNNNNLALKLIKNTTITTYRIGNTYFIKKEGIIYKLSPTTTFALLKEEKGKDIKNRIDKIDFEK